MPCQITVTDTLPTTFNTPHSLDLEAARAASFISMLNPPLPKSSMAASALALDFLRVGIAPMHSSILS